MSPAHASRPFDLLSGPVYIKVIQGLFWPSGKNGNYDFGVRVYRVQVCTNSLANSTLRDRFRV